MLRFAVRDGSSRMHACPLLSVQPPALHVTLRRGEPRGHHRTRTATMGGAFAAYKHATTGQPEANVGARLPVLTGRGGVRRHSISRCACSLLRLQVSGARFSWCSCVAPRWQHSSRVRIIVTL